MKAVIDFILWPLQALNSTIVGLVSYLVGWLFCVFKDRILQPKVNQN